MDFKCNMVDVFGYGCYHIQIFKATWKKGSHLWISPVFWVVTK